MVSQERSSPVYTAPHQSEWYKASAEVLSGVGGGSDVGSPVSISSTTEAALFAEAGYPTIVYGPGAPVANGHGPNEHVAVDQLERAVSF